MVNGLCSWLDYGTAEANVHFRGKTMAVRNERKDQAMIINDADAWSLWSFHNSKSCFYYLNCKIILRWLTEVLPCPHNVQLHLALCVSTEKIIINIIDSLYTLTTYESSRLCYLSLPYSCRPYSNIANDLTTNDAIKQPIQNTYGPPSLYSSGPPAKGPVRSKQMESRKRSATALRSHVHKSLCK